MSNIVTVAYATEGSTDQRFLETIIKNTVEDVAFECEALIEVFDPIFFPFPRTNGFSNSVIDLARQAHSNGIYILCIHADADDTRDINVINFKIGPAVEAINELQGNICKNIVPIIPVTMSESWMLADKELFKNEIGTTLSDEDLNINRNPETIANPKQVIKDAIRIAQSHLPRRRDRITISELYLSLGQKIKIEELEKLNSFMKFKLAVRGAFVQLNYLR
jgi:hypothetical protein